MKKDIRIPDAIRQIKIIPDYTEMAAGSVLIQCGKTKVICTASVEEGVPAFLKGTGKGWLTAEYAMLPGSTPNRKKRDGDKRDGRSVEIQRLIGRSLRAACDLTMLGERTIYIDCDVIQADGGTRTASISGAFVALCLAVDKLINDKVICDSPIRRQVAAISAGIVDEECMLDLEYQEDSRAEVDMNVVMSREIGGELKFVEVQGTGERISFKRDQLNDILDLAQRGVSALMECQLTALGDRAGVIGKKPRLIIASNNFGKIKEMKVLLGNRFEVMSMREAGLDLDVEEDGETFEENALIKARAVMKATGCAAVADDSGLMVEALGGRPGIHSARYCGVHGDDEANNQLLLKELSGKDNRRAAYACAIALVRPGRDPKVAYATCQGSILEEYRGDGGFGYDPLFYSDDLGKTFAQASPEEKNRVSHRALAIEKLREMLDREDA